jgi:hypothetical protein
MPLRKVKSKKDLSSKPTIVYPIQFLPSKPPQLPQLPYTPSTPLVIPTKTIHRRSRSFSNVVDEREQPWRSQATWRVYQEGYTNTGSEGLGLEIPSARPDGAGRGWRGRGGGGFFGNDGERVGVEKLGARGVLGAKGLNKIVPPAPVVKEMEKVEKSTPDRWAPGTATMLYRMKSQTNLRAAEPTFQTEPFPIELQYNHNPNTPARSSINRSTILSASTSTTSHDDLPPLLPSSFSQTSSPPSSIDSHHTIPPTPTQGLSMSNLLVELPPLLPGEISRQASFTSKTSRYSGEKPVPWGRKTPVERERRSVSPGLGFEITERRGGMREVPVTSTPPPRPPRRVEGRKEKEQGVVGWMVGMGATMGGIGSTGVVVEGKKPKSTTGGRGGWI